MRAARAGPVLRGQRFADEQILRGPALAALSGPVKGQCRLVCRVVYSDMTQHPKHYQNTPTQPPFFLKDG